MKAVINSAAATVKEFYSAYLCERDTEGALSLMSDGVLWIGAGAFEIAHSRAEAEKFMLTGQRSCPAGCGALLKDVTVRQVGSEVWIVCAVLKIVDKMGSGMQYRVTAVCALQGGRYRIAALHESTPGKGLLTDIKETKRRERDMHCQNERYRVLSEGVNTVTFDYDPETDGVSYSFCWRGRGMQERHIRRFSDFVRASGVYSEKYIRLYDEIMAIIRREPTRGKVDYQKNTPQGPRWNRLTYVSLGDETGKIYRIVGRVDDIQSEKEREESLRASAVRESAYRRSLTADALAAFEFDLDLGCRVPSELDVWPRSLPENVTFHELRMWFWYYELHPDDRSVFSSQFFDALSVGQNVPKDLYLECRLRRGKGRDPSYCWAGMTFAFIIEPRSRHRHVFICVRDVNSQKIEQLALKERAQRDSLTQLVNRASFEELVLNSLDVEKPGGSISAFFIVDLDNFKSINDTHGHSMGDEVLVGVAARLVSIFRTSDITARLGGDEMAVFMTNVTSEEAVRRKASEICAICRELRLSDPAVRVSCSVGIALAPEQGRSFTELYKRADRALYNAKEKGKNQFSLYSNSLEKLEIFNASTYHIGQSAQ